HFHLDPARGRDLHHSLFEYTRSLRTLVGTAADVRRQLAEVRVMTVRDAEAKARLHREVAWLTAAVRLIGAADVGPSMEAILGGPDLDARLETLAPLVARAVTNGSPETRSETLQALRREAERSLAAGAPVRGTKRSPLHWPLSFPEVFTGRKRAGFDA